MSDLRKMARDAGFNTEFDDYVIDHWARFEKFAQLINAAALTQPEPEPQLKCIHPLDIPLEVFVEDLSTRPKNIINAEMRYFTHSGDEYLKPPFTVRHLLMFSRTELAKWPNLGKRSLNEIEEMLRNHGLQLWHNHDERSLRLLRNHPTYYTAPPQRKPLTEEEIDEIIYSMAESDRANDRFTFVRAIERAHGIGGEE